MVLQQSFLRQAEIEAENTRRKREAPSEEPSGYEEEALSGYEENAAQDKEATAVRDLPTPRTRNPKPETRNPKPETRNPNPQTPTPNPEPQTPNHQPQTPTPKPQTPNPSTLTPTTNPQPSFCVVLEVKFAAIIRNFWGFSGFPVLTNQFLACEGDGGESAEGAFGIPFFPRRKPGSDQGGVPRHAGP